MIRQWAFTVAAVAVVALAAVLVIGALRPAPAPTLAQQATQLEAQLRCPDCQGLSVGESHTTSASAIRTEIVRQLQAGRTPAQVRDYFIARYGQWILLEPSSPLWIIIPFAVVVLAGLGLVAWLRAGRPASGALAPSAAADASPGETRDRIREEVEALDA